MSGLISNYSRKGLSGVWYWLVDDLGLFWSIFLLGFLAGSSFTLMLLFIVIKIFVPALIVAVAIT